MLASLERRQRVFEREWIAAQSNVLQAHAFEVLRFTVQDLAVEDQDEWRAYDLTRPDDVAELLRLRGQERGLKFRATVEFTYLASDGTLAVSVVHRELPELVFLEGWARPGRASIRFPEACYVTRLSPGGRPAQLTDWALYGTVMIAVSGSAHAVTAGSDRAPGTPSGFSGLDSAR
jgi:hypothetical protein